MLGATCIPPPYLKSWMLNVNLPLTSALFTVQTYGAAVWCTLALMGVSAVCASATDLAFDLKGYMWQLVNCVFTAGYSLYLRGVMDKVPPSLPFPGCSDNELCSISALI